MIAGKTLSLSNRYQDFSKYKNVVLVDNNFYLKKTNKSQKIKVVKNKAKNRKHIERVYSYCEKN